MIHSIFRYIILISVAGIMFHPLQLLSESDATWIIKYDKIDAEVQVIKVPPDEKWKSVVDFIESINGEFLDGIVSGGSGGFNVVRIQKAHLNKLLELVTESSEVIKKEISDDAHKKSVVVVRIQIDDPKFLEKELSGLERDIQIRKFEYFMLSPVGIIISCLILVGILALLISQHRRFTTAGTRRKN